MRVAGGCGGLGEYGLSDKIGGKLLGAGWGMGGVRGLWLGERRCEGGEECRRGRLDACWGEGVGWR